MAQLLLNGNKIDFSIREELETFDWQRATWLDDRLMAASPFRADNHPSFYVYLEDTATSKAGYWGDSGTGDKGGFVQLLAYLRGESESETIEYLVDTYAISPTDTPKLRPPKLRIQRDRQTLNESELDGYSHNCDYLAGRGIAPVVARYCGIRYDEKRRAIAIPWRRPSGKLAAVKYRSTAGKTFWYASGGTPIRELVYGLDVVYKRQAKRVVIVEAEIDALYCMSAGTIAVAVGGKAFNEAKRDAILRSPIEEIVIMADHDSAGQALKRQIIAQLGGQIRLSIAGFPRRYKDANDVKSTDELRGYIARAKPVHVRKFGTLRIGG